MPKIAIYAITRDEAANVVPWFDNIQDADCVRVGMLPVKDVCERGPIQGQCHSPPCGNLVDKRAFEIEINPWRYDDAMNAVLATIPTDVDICIALQLDERLSDDWRKAIEEVWTPHATRLSYKYVWDAEHTLMQNRIHQRHGYRWKFPVHGGVYPDRISERQIVAPKLTVTKNMDKKKKSRSNTLELLQHAVIEYPHSARMAHYLGREYMYHKRYAEALTWLHKYDSLEGGWPLERSQNREYIARCEREKIS